ncbi:MAG: spore cortex biosynthesis protein YabQ [Clostridia bacterium]|nr:spore cortex biosynthesis protein YabQ [Clostridia bacterium]
MYGFPLYTQLRCLFYFLGLGFLLGVVYDLLRFIRLSVSAGRPLLYICDCLYAVLFGAAVYSTCLAVSYGELHLYMLIGAVTGFSVYYFTFDSFIRRMTGRIVRGLKRCYHVVFRVFSLPVRAVMFVCEKICKILAFPVKKIAKFFKYLLQNIKKLLYNKYRFYSKVFPHKKPKKEESHF